MRFEKRLLRPESVRRIPEQFSWVDHRLIRDRRLADCSHAGWALYLFLVTVGDAQGLSYYSDRSLCAHLGMQSVEALCGARAELIRACVIAYAVPIYQVLALNAGRSVFPSHRRRPRATGKRWQWVMFYGRYWRREVRHDVSGMFFKVAASL